MDWLNRISTVKYLVSTNAIRPQLRIAHFDNIGNRFGSPYLISVSRKK